MEEQGAESLRVCPTKAEALLDELTSTYTTDFSDMSNSVRISDISCEADCPGLTATPRKIFGRPLPSIFDKETCGQEVTETPVGDTQAQSPAERTINIYHPPEATDSKPVGHIRVIQEQAGYLICARVGKTDLPPIGPVSEDKVEKHLSKQQARVNFFADQTMGDRRTSDSVFL